MRKLVPDLNEGHESEVAAAAEEVLASGATVPGYVTRAHHGWRLKHPFVLDIVSQVFSADMMAIGSTPYIGDMSETGLLLPVAATVDQKHRYLVRLCTFEVPNGSAAIILGVHTAHTLRTVLTAGEGDAACFRPVEILVREPFWHPPNGNISWHLREYQLMENPRYMNDPSVAPGQDIYIDGDGTALLHNRVVSFAPYRPPGAGLPPGRGIGAIGTWRDNRDWETYSPVYGPKKVGLWCSVHQFDSANICDVAAPLDLGAISQEDRFVFQYRANGCSYGHVAGGLSVEFWPDADLLRDRLVTGRLFQRRSEP